MSPVRHKRPAVAAIDVSGCLRSQHDAEFGRRRMPRSSRIGVCSSFAEGGMGVLFEVLDVRGSAPESRVQAADHFYCLKSRQAESGQFSYRRPQEACTESSIFSLWEISMDNLNPAWPLNMVRLHLFRNGHAKYSRPGSGSLLSRGSGREQLRFYASHPILL